MSRNARIAALMVAIGLTVTALLLDVTGVASREWWRLALPAVAIVVLVFVLIREVRVR